MALRIVKIPAPREEAVHARRRIATGCHGDVTSTGSFGTGVRQMQVQLDEGVLDGRKLYRFSTPNGATLRTDTAVAAILGPADKVLMRYEPPLGPGWPFEVGRSMTQDLMLTTADGNRHPMTASWKIEAYEDVTVPAGTFKAWRITMADNFGFRTVIWSVPERIGTVKQFRERSASHPQGGAGTELMELAAMSIR